MSQRTKSRRQKTAKDTKEVNSGDSDDHLFAGYEGQYINILCDHGKDIKMRAVMLSELIDNLQNDYNKSKQDSSVRLLVACM